MKGGMLAKYLAKEKGGMAKALKFLEDDEKKAKANEEADEDPKPKAPREERVIKRYTRPKEKKEPEVSESTEKLKKHLGL